MKKIVINADDYGLSEGICKAINSLFEINAISSTSLMLAAPNAVTTIKKWLSDDFIDKMGVHLQLTSGIPLSPTKNIPSLIHKNTFRNPCQGSPVVPSEVELEWRLQINKAIKLIGDTPKHLDSHHGVHRIPSLFPIYIKLANEYNIPVRGAVSGEIREEIIKNHLNSSVAILRNWTGKNLNSTSLIEQLIELKQKEVSENVIEIISHPGFSDSYLESISTLNKARENDYNVLKELSENNWWNKNNFELVSYKNLRNGFARCN